MDLLLLSRVLWRFRFLVALGVIAGSALAFFAAVQIEVSDGSPRLSYRHAEEWRSQATLLVTEQGFPEGHKAPSPSEWEQEAPTRTAGDPGFAEPHRFVELALVYANLVDTDAVRESLPTGALRDATLGGAARGLESGEPIPFVDVVAVAASAEAAKSLARSGAEALRDYVASQEIANGIPEDERVTLRVVAYPREAELVVARPTALPLIAFLAVVLIVVAIAFVVENVRPRSAASRPELRPSRL